MLAKARERFVFEELLLFQLSTGLSKYNLKVEKRNCKYKNVNLKPFYQGCHFQISTKGQKKVLNDIINDFNSEHIMNRLSR